MNFILNTPIYNLFIVACILTGIAFISLVMMIIFRKKCLPENIDTDKYIIQKVNANSANKYQLLFKLSRCITIVITTFALIFMTMYMFYNHKAISYGAFDGYMHIESINSINEKTKNAFIDQSKDLPSDLSGCIIIYFKYGCDDCSKTYDDINKCLSENNVENVYFVSSRSEIGEELRNIYPIDAVPSGVYIRKDTSLSVKHYTKVLFSSQTDSNDVEFLEENLMYLINAQKEGK